MIVFLHHCNGYRVNYKLFSSLKNCSMPFIGVLQFIFYIDMLFTLNAKTIYNPTPPFDKIFVAGIV